MRSYVNNSANSTKNAALASGPSREFRRCNTLCAPRFVRTNASLIRMSDAFMSINASFVLSNASFVRTSQLTCHQSTSPLVSTNESLVRTNDRFMLVFATDLFSNGYLLYSLSSPAKSLKTSHRLFLHKRFSVSPPPPSQVGTTPPCTLHPVTCPLLSFPVPSTLHPVPCTLSSMRPSQPERTEFLRLARTHSLVPLYRTLTADLETPVSAFLRIAATEPEAFLLESVEGGEVRPLVVLAREQPDDRERAEVHESIGTKIKDPKL